MRRFIFNQFFFKVGTFFCGEKDLALVLKELANAKTVDIHTAPASRGVDKKDFFQNFSLSHNFTIIFMKAGRSAGVRLVTIWESKATS